MLSTEDSSHSVACTCTFTCIRTRCTVCRERLVHSSREPLVHLSPVYLRQRQSNCSCLFHCLSTAFPVRIAIGRFVYRFETESARSSTAGDGTLWRSNWLDLHTAGQGIALCASRLDIVSCYTRHSSVRTVCLMVCLMVWLALSCPLRIASSNSSSSL